MGEKDTDAELAALRAQHEQEVYTFQVVLMEGHYLPGGGGLQSLTVPGGPMQRYDVLNVYIQKDTRKEDIVKALRKLTQYIEENWYRVTTDELWDRALAWPAAEALDDLGNPSADSPPPLWPLDDSDNLPDENSQP